MHSTIGRRWLRVVLALLLAPGYQEGVAHFWLDHPNEA
jgi:hypothetical protein